MESGCGGWGEDCWEKARAQERPRQNRVSDFGFRVLGSGLKNRHGPTKSKLWITKLKISNRDRFQSPEIQISPSG